MSRTRDNQHLPSLLPLLPQHRIPLHRRRMGPFRVRVRVWVRVRFRVRVRIRVRVHSDAPGENGTLHVVQSL